MEDTLKFRIEMAERQLAALQSFYPRIDAKVSAIFAVSSAQIAIAALNLKIEDLERWPEAVMAVLFFISTAFLHVNLYLCLYPALAPSSRALSFFGHVAQTGESEFIKEYISTNHETLLEDISRQIWRNSHIVAAKFKYLKHGSIALFASLVPWTALLLTLSIGAWKLPALTN